MNSYKYRITNEIYNSIVNGTKRIEIRLYNDKSSKINIGDYINFCVLNNEEKRIKVQVKALLRYKNINDLINDSDIELLIGNKYTKEDLEEMLKNIYGEKLSNHDILGIKFDIIKEDDILISEDIDKDIYIKELTKDKVINLTGESGSGKSTYAREIFNSNDYIVIDTDLIFGNIQVNEGIEKYLRKYVYDEYKDKYKEALYNDFDKVYLMILDYFKNNNKTIVIDSAQFRNIKDISILKGSVIVVRTSINTCYKRCINRYKERNMFATEEAINDYSLRKKNMYNWYHSLNDFLRKIDNY